MTLLFFKHLLCTIKHNFYFLKSHHSTLVYFINLYETDLRSDEAILSKIFKKINYDTKDRENNCRHIIRKFNFHSHFKVVCSHKGLKI